MAYVRASGDLATVRAGCTRVVKSLWHRSLRAFVTSSGWPDHALLAASLVPALRASRAAPVEALREA